MKDCEESTGLAYDSRDRLVISVCSNGLAKLIAADGKKVASVSVGSGAARIGAHYGSSPLPT